MTCGTPPEPDRLLGDKVVTLRPPLGRDTGRFPGYLEMADLTQIGSVGTTGCVSIDIEPVTPGLRYWAFVSVTHTVTQHVTTITP